MTVAEAMEDRKALLPGDSVHVFINNANKLKKHTKSICSEGWCHSFWGCASLL